MPVLYSNIWLLWKDTTFVKIFGFSFICKSEGLEFGLPKAGETQIIQTKYIHTCSC